MGSFGARVSKAVASCHVRVQCCTRIHQTRSPPCLLACLLAQTATSGPKATSDALSPAEAAGAGTDTGVSLTTPTVSGAGNAASWLPGSSVSGDGGVDESKGEEDAPLSTQPIEPTLAASQPLPSESTADDAGEVRQEVTETAFPDWYYQVRLHTDAARMPVCIHCDNSSLSCLYRPRYRCLVCCDHHRCH
jgi:hypothetical protein